MKHLNPRKELCAVLVNAVDIGEAGGKGEREQTPAKKIWGMV